MRIECGVLDKMQAVNLIPRDTISEHCLHCGRNTKLSECPFLQEVKKLDDESRRRAWDPSDEPFAY